MRSDTEIVTACPLRESPLRFCLHRLQHIWGNGQKIPPSSLRFDAIQYNTATLQPDKLNLSDSESCKVEAGSTCCQVTLFDCVRFCVKPL